jgi:hypothetical protein
MKNSLTMNNNDSIKVRKPIISSNSPICFAIIRIIVVDIMTFILLGNATNANEGEIKNYD